MSTITEEKLREMAAKATSIRDLSRKLNLNEGRYNVVLKEMIKTFNINTDHWIKAHYAKWRRDYSIEQLQDAIKGSISIAQVLSALDLDISGANYRGFRLAVKKYNLDISHFTGQAHSHNKQCSYGIKIPTKDILVKNSTYGNTNTLKIRLIKEGVLINKCIVCGIDKWQDKILVLHLDHVNGDNLDNRLENLRLLCPNCHSQTDTYSGRNKNKH